MNTRKILTFLAVISAVGSYAEDAAAKKKGPLEGEPIVRQKLQLRRFRFQLTPYVGMSLSQPFVHMGYVGAKATFHFADWIGARGTFGYGIVPVESRLLRAVNDGGLPSVDSGPGGMSNGAHPPGTNDPTLPGMVTCMNQAAPCRNSEESNNPAPLLHDFRAGLTRAQWQASVDVVFTPFAGKLGLFSALFTEYDIYIFGGLGLIGYQKQYNNRSTAQLEGLDTNPDSPNYCAAGGRGQDSECLLNPVKADEGVRVGGSFGGGLNLFLADWVSLNLEFQDILVNTNLAGLNSTIDDIPPVVDNDDRDLFHNVTLQIGPRFYFPFKAKRTK
jgi:outer membrane beta-barrel protein